MSSQLVITALCKDRPGIVDALSDALFGFKLNIEDSRMSVLGGEFAILLLVGGDEVDISAAEEQCEALGRQLDMQVMCKRTRSSPSSEPRTRYDIEVVAIDNPGIVHQLASFFSSREINIQDLVTERYAAAHTATPMFAVNMSVSIPDNVDVDGLRDAFLNQCDELNLDASMNRADPSD
jgi:glycine cleavage system transcriptional repressor